MRRTTNLCDARYHDFQPTASTANCRQTLAQSSYDGVGHEPHQTTGNTSNAFLARFCAFSGAWLATGCRGARGGDLRNNPAESGEGCADCANACGPACTGRHTDPGA